MTTPLPLRTKLYFGTGAIATGVKETAFNVFLLFFYTQVVGLPGAWAGTAILVALVVDAISDPLVGAWSDRFRSRLGRRHPFMYAAALPMGGAFYCLFVPPLGASDTTLMAWLIGWAVLTRLCMTFYAVPSTAMTAELTDDYDDRTSLASFRVLFGWIGGLVFATTSYLVFFAPSETFDDGRLSAQGYADFALAGAFSIVAAILVCAIGTHPLIPRLKSLAGHSAPSQGLRSDLANVAANRPFLVLMVTIFVAAAAIGFTDAIGLYLFTYFWGLSTDQLAGLTLGAALGTVAAFAFAAPLSRRYDKHVVAIGAAGLLTLAYPALLTARLVGLLPANGDPLIFGLLVVNANVSVFGAVTLSTMFASMVADTIDRNELTSGQRQEAIHTSAYTLSFKATSGIGGFLAGVVLDLVELPRQAEAATLSADRLEMLGATVACVMVGLWGLAILVLTRYPLNRSAHEAVLRALEAARAYRRSEVG